METNVRIGFVLFTLGVCAVSARAVGVMPVDEVVSQAVTVGKSVITVYCEDRAREVPPSLFGDFPEKDIAATVGTNKLLIGMNFFSFTADDKLVFVDSGRGAENSPFRKLFPPLSKIRRPDVFLITHGHHDHVGGLLDGDAPRFPGTMVYISRPEIAYWSKDEHKESAAGRVIALYGDRIVPFDFDTEILPGVWARNAVGHTPGHTVFETADVLFIGDLLHVAALQFARPDACTIYDMDKPASIAMRKEWLAKAVQSGKPVAGIHIPFPGITNYEL